MDPLRGRILNLARQIPAGRVTTYGDLARMAGAPRAAREVGRALGAVPEGGDVPWWRVLNRFGHSSLPPECAGRQTALLRDEGVELNADGGVDLDRFRWSPTEPADP